MNCQVEKPAFSLKADGRSYTVIIGCLNRKIRYDGKTGKDTFLRFRIIDFHANRVSSIERIRECFVTPTLTATPGDLSLVIPKRILDGIIEMIYALDKIAPGTANDDTLLYGVEVKFYNMEVEIDENLETERRGLYVIGDGSGVTHSLSHASASGVFVARRIMAV